MPNRGRMSLYLHGMSRTSSTKPNKTLNTMLTRAANFWVIRTSDRRIRKRTMDAKDISMKMVALTKPRDYGISLFPASVPLLLISIPKILFLSMYCSITGIILTVIKYPTRLSMMVRLTLSNITLYCWHRMVLAIENSTTHPQIFIWKPILKPT